MTRSRKHSQTRHFFRFRFWDTRIGLYFRFAGGLYETSHQLTALRSPGSVLGGSSCFLRKYRNRYGNLRDRHMPELEVGQTLPEPSLSVAEDAPYEITSYSWRCEDDIEYFENVPVGTVVEDGYRYKLSVEITAKEGYALDWSTQLYLNGSNNGFTHSMNEFAHYIDYAYSYLPAVDTVEITVPEPIFGQAPGEITVPEGVHYRIDEKDWNRSTGDDMNNFVFKDDYFYSLHLRIKAEDGYQIPKDAEVYLNGELYTDVLFLNEDDIIDVYVYYNYEKTSIYYAAQKLDNVLSSTTQPITLPHYII